MRNRFHRRARFQSRPFQPGRTWKSALPPPRRRGQIGLPRGNGLRYDIACGLATAMELVPASALSGRVGDHPGADRSGKAPALSTRLQSAVAGPWAALRLRFLLFQPAWLYPNEPDAAAGHRARLRRFRTRHSRGAQSAHGPRDRSGGRRFRGHLLGTAGREKLAGGIVHRARSGDRCERLPSLQSRPAHSAQRHPARDRALHFLRAGRRHRAGLHTAAGPRDDAPALRPAVGRTRAADAAIAGDGIVRVVRRPVPHRRRAVRVQRRS